MSERTITGAQGGDEAAALCVLCQSPLAQGEARCGHCGAAVAPGGYRVKRQIAQGPYSRVLLAEKDGREVALKELLFALVPDAAQLDAFEREAQLLRQLDHPRIPRLVESFKEGEGVSTRLYLAQEFVRGRSLLDELAERRFDEAGVKDIAHSLLDVLLYLHGRSPRVIHRDVKPANVMRRPDGQLALVDFGAARDLVRGQTHGSTLVGTFGYMPPEQMGGTVDETSDLYALGATLIHLLARKPPDELLRPGMELAFREAVNVSPGMEAFLARLVERDRTKRYRTARAAKEALDALDAPVRAPARQKAVAEAARPGWSKAGLITVGFLALVAAGAVAWASAGLSTAPEPPVAAVVVTPVSDAPKVVVPAASVAPVVRPAKVVTVAKPVAPAFRLEKDLDIGLDESVTLQAVDGQGAECPTPSKLELVNVRLQVEGATEDTSKLGVDAVFHNRGGPPGCQRVYVQVLDQAGRADPSRATVLSSREPSSAKKTSFEFQIPRSSKSVSLRVGPANQPLGRFDLNLVTGTATRR
jgi:hypothetical protein